MLRLAIAIGLVAACARTTAPPSPSSSPSAPPPPPPSVAVPATAPLFTFVEGADELAFWPPVTLRLVRAGDGGTRTCTSTLSTGADNMWTGPDVEAAFAAADVQAALRGGTVSFQAPIDDAGTVEEATLRTPKGTIEWKLRACRYCVAPAPSVAHLRDVLAGVMMNRRLLCP